MFSFFSKKNESVPKGPKLPVKEIEKRILAIADEKLVSLGFSRDKKHNIWLRTRSSIVTDRVAVSFIEKFAAEWILATIVVGIQCPVLLDLLGQAFGYNYPKIHGVFGTLIGYVMPAGKPSGGEWKFPREQEPEEEARKMMSAFINYGLPFMEHYDSLEVIIGGERQFGLLGFRNVIELSALEYLAGRSDDARKTLEEALAHKDAPDEEKSEYQIPSKEKARKLFAVFENDTVRNSILGPKIESGALTS
jgi:hypothetical protein